MSSFSNAVKIDLEKFDGRINFDLWKIQVKDILIQLGLHKVSNGNISNMDNAKWEELDLRVSSTIRMSLAKNILANVLGMSSVKELLEKLEMLYQRKGISNRLLLKELFHSLHMDEHTKVSDHQSVLNGIVSELETIGVKIHEKDKALRLIWSIPFSYEHIKLVLIYGK